MPTIKTGIRFSKKQPLSEQEVLDAAEAARETFSALVLGCLERL